MVDQVPIFNFSLTIFPKADVSTWTDEKLFTIIVVRSKVEFIDVFYDFFVYFVIIKFIL